jgi:hypothetical protein
MHSRFSLCFVLGIMLIPRVGWSQATRPQAVPRSGGDFSNSSQPLTRVPKDVILVKGAWSSSSDSTTPVPEEGSVTNSVFTDRYFGMTYPLPKDWVEKYTPPPPSDSGRYVLAQIRSAEAQKGSNQGSILITADDLFFTPLPANNTLEFVDFEKENLQADHKLELPLAQTRIAGRNFYFLAYWSPTAQLHWYVVATQIRCHVVEVALTSRDTKLLGSLILEMNKMQLPVDADPAAGTGGGSLPVCIKDYVNEANLVARVDPVFTEHRFNTVPVRIIIDKAGRVKHIHFLSAFPDQAKAIADALKQWKFRPYVKDGKRVEVETGIVFGRARPPMQRQAKRVSVD